MDEDIRMAIGKRIADIREKKGLTLRALEELSGVGHAHISRIEQGKYNIRIDILDKIAKALGVSIKIE